MPGKLVLIIGPSGVGKSVILKELRKRLPELHFPRSATTRERRPSEGDELYHFVTDDAFDALIKDGKLIEWATVHGGARYGALREEIIPFIEEGKIVVREVDVQGFESIRNDRDFSGPNPRLALVSIFILPDSKNQLIRRIQHRAPIGKEELAHRIASMEKELSYVPLCTVTVKNHEDGLEQTVRAVEEAIR